MSTTFVITRYALIFFNARVKKFCLDKNRHYHEGEVWEVYEDPVGVIEGCLHENWEVYGTLWGHRRSFI